VTDANLVLGRLRVKGFPCIFGPDQNEPLDVAAARRAFVELTATINAFLAGSEATDRAPMTVEQV